MKDNSLGRKTTSGFLWRFFERVGAQGVTFVVSIIIARILDTKVYGTVALMTVFTNLLSTFIDSGMGTALIQKKDADDLDFSSLFYFNLTMCLLLYMGMFFAAPWIAAFYGRPELTAMVRVVSLTLIISGVKNIQHAYVSRHLLFKRFFFATLGGTIGAAVIGIWMAYRGYGAWALIAQSLFNNTVDTIILWVTVKWRPKKMFSFERLKGLFSYGWKLLLSKLLDKGYTELRTLIIGKKYSANDLSFYNRGSNLPSIAIENINSSIDSVLFPTLSTAQDDPAQVKAMIRRSITVSSYLIMPLMMGLAVCGESLVRIFLTEKWLPCVFFMRIFCFSYAFWPIHTANLNAMKAMGRSDLFLKLETIKKIVGLAAILSTMWISVKAMAYSVFFTSIASQIINTRPNKKLLKYGYLEQLKDILPGILLAVGMGVIVYCVQFLHLNDWLTLLIQVPLGAALYFAGSKLFRLEAYTYVLGIARSYLKKKA